jgi:hypothetical protein
MMTNKYDYFIQLKTDKTKTIVFAEGPAGEILYIAAFPGLEQEVDPYRYKQYRDRILDNNHHIKAADEYKVIKTVSPYEASVMFGLPELSPSLIAQADMRRGIQTVTAAAIKEIKG